ncbi:MAG: SprT-like domain-containing protein [Nocardioides sp.]|uniref:SprT-like domain-containing protein n=1 Tax=Nocardioides sp. TaxID=35761 RepID=UPI003EFFAB22
MDLDDARRLAVDEMTRHGLRGWTFAYDRAKRRAGATHFADRRITLSRELTGLHDEAEVRQTVLHEIAHALVGPRHGHDATWRATALRIGSNGQRCLARDTPTVSGAWVGVCPAGHQTDAHRRPVRVKACRQCTGEFAERVFSWTHHGRAAPMHPQYEEELAALRAGTLRVRFAEGSRVRITAHGRWHGAQGVVVKRGRTRYHVQTGRHLLTVPFAGVTLL